MTAEKQSLSPQERRRLIVLLSDDGLSSTQIAERLGISQRRVNRIAARAGLQIGKSGGSARLGCWVPRRLIGHIGDLANDAGCSRSAMVARVIEAVCSDPAFAKKLLGKEAMPVRGYRVGEVG